MSALASYFLAARPKTLTASIIPIWAGCMVVWRITGAWNWRLALLTTASCMCIQIACNLFNDAIDHRKQADTKRRTGPMRVTASGLLSERAVITGALVFLAAACGFSVPLIELRGWPIIAIGIPSLYFAYGYTGGPFPLAYRGLGEIFVVLFFGLIAVLGTILVQVGMHADVLRCYHAGIVVGIQCGLLSAVMISVNNIRDRAEDATTGKNTLAVRLGNDRARGLALSFILAAYITLPTAFRALALSFDEIWKAWIPSFLFAGVIIFMIRKTPANEKMNKVLALSSLHLIVYLFTYTFC